MLAVKTITIKFTYGMAIGIACVIVIVLKIMGWGD